MSRTFDSYTQFDIYIMVEMMFIIFYAHDFLCVDDGIVISNRSTSGDGAENITPVRQANWTTQ